MTKATYCEDCDHVVDRKRAVSQWCCVKFPRLEGMGFVGPRVWAETEPHMKCAGINGGACPMYVPRRGEQ